MDDSTNNTDYGKPEMYSGGVSSLIGVSSGISLDGDSVRLPGDDGFEMNDDISSIHDGSSYYPNGYHSGMTQASQMRIVGTAASMEEGTTGTGMDQLSPASIALSEQIRKVDERTAKREQEEAMSHGVPLGSGGESEKTPPNMKNTNKIKIKRDKNRNGCLPLWVQEAPRWLKLVIAVSTALLVGAVVLVTVALSTALADQSDSSKASANLSRPGLSSPAVTPTPTPTSNTVSNPWAGTPEPTVPLATEKPEQGGSTAQTPEPTSGGSDATQPTSPASSPQEEAETDSNATATPATTSPGSASSFDSNITTFFVTGGRFTNDALKRVPDQLKTLPVRGGTSFLVQLGDWNSPYATRCDRQSYQDVYDLYSNSSIPVYFVPGDNDFNDCPEPEQAISFWREYLLEYESQHWPEPSAWTVNRDNIQDYPENFAFVYNEILFIGINLVGGVIHDSREWATRQEANLRWIDDNYQEHRDTIKAFVLFAHADPDVPSNSPFFEPFKERVSDEYNQVPVVLIHRNLGVEPWSWETEFENIPNFSVVVVTGSVWPPLMGAIDFRQAKPFIFDQSNWYDEYLQHQRSRGVGLG